MTIEKTFYPSATLNQITDAAFAYTKVLMVARDGVTYDILVNNSIISLTSRQVLHQPANGVLYFDFPFIQNESVNIVYETNP